MAPAWLRSRGRARRCNRGNPVDVDDHEASGPKALNPIFLFPGRVLVNSVIEVTSSKQATNVEATKTTITFVLCEQMMVARLDTDPEIAAWRPCL